MNIFGQTYINFIALARYNTYKAIQASENGNTKEALDWYRIDWSIYAYWIELVFTKLINICKLRMIWVIIQIIVFFFLSNEIIQLVEYLSIPPFPKLRLPWILEITNKREKETIKILIQKKIVWNDQLFYQIDGSNNQNQSSSYSSIYFYTWFMTSSTWSTKCFECMLYFFYDSSLGNINCIGLCIYMDTKQCSICCWIY